MAVKGAIAKQRVVDIISNAFGENFIGEYDKKFYVWSEENGEKVQVAISLTCPKTPIAAATPPKAKVEVKPKLTELNFEDDFEMEVPKPKKEISADERANIEELMRKLGL